MTPFRIAFALAACLAAVSPALAQQPDATERIGPFLDGAVRLVEGRSYKPDGSLAFSDRGTTRYITVFEDGVWREVGERIVAGQPPARFIELELRRVGDSTWPAAGAVGPE